MVLITSDKTHAAAEWTQNVPGPPLQAVNGYNVFSISRGSQHLGFSLAYRMNVFLLAGTTEVCFSESASENRT